MEYGNYGSNALVLDLESGSNLGWGGAGSVRFGSGLKSAPIYKT